MKRKVFIVLLVLVQVLAIAWAVVSSLADEEWLVYIPVAHKGITDLAPTTTPVPSPTSTPTPTPTPDPWMSFLTGYEDNRMKGLVTGNVRRTSLTNYWGDTLYPMGIYIVLFMDVVNWEMESAYVSGISTFWMRDGTGPFYDMAPLDAQFAAEHEYDRVGVYEDLQPRFTYQMVFVFDVPIEGLYGIWYRPWGMDEAQSLGHLVDH